MYPRIKFQSKKEFDAYMWRATYGFTGRQFEAGLMNLHVRSAVLHGRVGGRV